MAAELLADLIGQGFQLLAEGDNLRVTPKRRLTPLMREQIRTHKAALLACLRKSRWTEEDFAWIAEAIALDQGLPPGRLKLSRPPRARCPGCRFCQARGGA